MTIQCAPLPFHINEDVPVAYIKEKEEMALGKMKEFTYNSDGWVQSQPKSATGNFS